jgi:nitrate reductase NapE component
MSLAVSTGAALVGVALLAVALLQLAFATRLIPLAATITPAERRERLALALAFLLLGLARLLTSEALGLVGLAVWLAGIAAIVVRRRRAALPLAPFLRGRGS